MGVLIQALREEVAGRENIFSHPAGLIIIVLVWCENKVWTPPLDLPMPSVLV